jgi:hypothetical protein
MESQCLAPTLTLALTLQRALGPDPVWATRASSASAHCRARVRVGARVRNYENQLSLPFFP